MPCNQYIFFSASIVLLAIKELVLTSIMLSAERQGKTDRHKEPDCQTEIGRQTQKRICKPKNKQ